MANSEHEVNNNSYEECAICESRKKEGMYLYNIFLCSECEDSLIHTEANDPLYKQHVEKLRKIDITGMYSCI